MIKMPLARSLMATAPVFVTLLTTCLAHAPVAHAIDIHTRDATLASIHNRRVVAPHGPARPAAQAAPTAALLEKKRKTDRSTGGSYPESRIYSAIRHNGTGSCATTSKRTTLTKETPGIYI